MKANDPRLSQLSPTDRLALIPEPSREAKLAVKAAVAEERIRNRRRGPALLTTGTIARTDVYGFRGHDARVVEDPGPESLSTRKVKLEKISGRLAGEQITVSRDRVRPVPGH